MESEERKGSIFHFTAKFRLQKTPAKKTIPVEPEDLHNLPVLVMDDNATNRIIFLEMLTKWNMTPQAVDNAPGGVIHDRWLIRPRLRRQDCRSGILAATVRAAAGTCYWTVHSVAPGRRSYSFTNGRVNYTPLPGR